MRSPLRRSGPRRGNRGGLSCSTRRGHGRLATMIDGSDDVTLLASFNGGALRQLRWLRALSSRAKSTKPGSTVSQLSTKSDQAYTASLRRGGTQLRNISSLSRATRSWPRRINPFMTNIDRISQGREVIYGSGLDGSGVHRVSVTRNEPDALQVLGHRVAHI
jgi:hypothetical protein